MEGKHQENGKVKYISNEEFKKTLEKVLREHKELLDELAKH